MNKKSLTPFVDALFLFLLVFITITMLIKSTKESDPALSANVIYQIVMDWPGESNADMDLWAKDSQGHIVGFNRREGGEGSLISLAHDDLGSRNDTHTNKKDTVKVNQEIISIRGFTEGEYTVNVHDYFHPSAEKSVKVSCKLVKIKPFKEIVKSEIELNSAGQEETFFRFVFDSNGNVTETNHLPQKIAKLGQGEESAPTEQ